MRPLQIGTFPPISASGSNFNPRNIQYIPLVEIFVFLELEQKLPDDSAGRSNHKFLKSYEKRSIPWE